MDLRSFVLDVPDFPTPGILFRDITPLLASPQAFSHAVTRMADPFRGIGFEKILGIEARGFMFGAAMARELGIGFVPARKPGKLPRATERVAYGLEYGRAAIEIHADALRRGERVLLADDVLATGGTAAAAMQLVEKVGGEVVGATFLIELAALAGRERLAGRTVHSVLVL